MNRNIIVKTEDASSEHAKCVKKGKYSWQEDACVWLQHHKRTVPVTMDSLISTRSFDSITGRLKVLRDIERALELGQADLSDRKNIEMWNAYINFKLGKYYKSRFVPQIDTDAIAALSEKLNVASDFLLSRLQLIRSTKHFLYFSGIHVNESLSMEDYDVTHLAPAKRKYKARTTLNDAPKTNNAGFTVHEAPKTNNAGAKMNDVPKINNAGFTVHEAPKRSNNLTLSELQALYRFRNLSYSSCSVIDLASEFSKSVDAVRHGLNNLIMQTTEAERIVQEGVTLRWGDDSDLWSGYVSRYVGSTHPANIHISNIIAEEIARERNTGVLHTHFRLNLIRNLKKFLHIAGIHNEQPSGLQPQWEHHSMDESAFVGTSAPHAGVSDTSGLVVSLDGELVRKAVAAVLNSAVDVLVQQKQRQIKVTDTLAWMITTLEVNAVIDKDVGIILAGMVNAVVGGSAESVTAVALVDPAVESLNDALDEGIVPPDKHTVGQPSDTVAFPAHGCDFADAMVSLFAELEAEDTSGLQQVTFTATTADYKVATVPTLDCSALPIAIHNSGLRSTTANVSPCRTDISASIPRQPGALSNAVPLLDPYAHTIEDAAELALEPIESSTVELPTFACSATPATSVPPTSSATQSISTTSTIYPLPSPLPSPLLAPPITPFAFSLTNEADIWRAYVKSQQPSSHKSLPSRLQKLAKKLNCTFPQIKDKLSELINLQLGLTVQCHSSSRPFTAAEEAVIAAASASSDNTTIPNHSTTGVKGGNATSAYRILEVATQLRCSIGAVAVRCRQLKTLRLLQEVGNHTHAKLNKAPALPLHAPLQSSTHPLPSLPTATLPPLLRKLTPATLPTVHICPAATVSSRDQDCSDSSHPHTSSLLGKRHYTSTDNTNNHKITRTDGFSECNAYESADDEENDIIAYFSTDGEASDG